MNFTADNFSMAAFCHALHIEEREAERMPVRIRNKPERLDYSRQAGTSCREYSQPVNRDRMVAP